MKQKSNGLLNKLTHAKANVWLVSIIVVLFISGLVIVNYSAQLEGVSSYAKSNTYSSQSQLVASTPGSTNPSVTLIPDPATTGFNKLLYVTPTFSNVTGCIISRPQNVTPNTDIALTDFDSGHKIVVGTSPNSPGILSFKLSCLKSTDGQEISAKAIINIVDPQGSPIAFITGQEITNGKQSISPPAVGPSNTNISMDITEGSSLRVDRLCVSGLSGYITNADGTILTPTSSKNLPSETLYITHDNSGTPNGIHSDKVYTVHCFSKVGNKGVEKTVALNVNVR